MAELVVAGKREFQGDAKGLDGHDGDGTDSRADGQIDECVLLAMDRRDSVDHEDGKRHNANGVQEEAYAEDMGQQMLKVSQ